MHTKSIYFFNSFIGLGVCVAILTLHRVHYDALLQRGSKQDNKTMFKWANTLYISW